MTRSESPHRRASAAVQRRLKERDGRLSTLLVNGSATALSGDDYAAVQKELQENQKMEQEAASMRLLLQQQAEAAERAQAQQRQQLEASVMQQALQQQQQAPAAAQAQMRMQQQQTQGQGTHNQQRGQNTTEEPDPFATFVEDRGHNEFTASASWLESADNDDGWTTVSRTTPKLVNESGSLSYAQMQQIQYQEHHERYKREQAALYAQAQQRHYQQQQQALRKQAEVLTAANRQQQQHQAHDQKQPSHTEAAQEPKNQAPPPSDAQQQVHHHEEMSASNAGNKSSHSSGTPATSTSSGHRPVPLRQNSRRRVLPRMSTNPKRTQPQETELGHGRGLGSLSQAALTRPSLSEMKRGQACSKMAQTPTAMSAFSFGPKSHFSQNHVWSIVVDTPPGHCMAGGRGLELVEECSAEDESQERSVGWQEKRRKQKLLEEKVLKAAAGEDPADGESSVSSSSVSSGSRRRKHRRGTYRKTKSVTRKDKGIANNPADDSDELDPVDEDEDWDWELSDTSSECEPLDSPMSVRSSVDDYNDRIKRKEASLSGVGATSVPVPGSSYDTMLKKKNAPDNRGSGIGFTAVSGAPDDAAALKKKNASYDRAASGVGVTLVKGPPPKHPDGEELSKIQNGEGVLYEDFTKKTPLARTIRMKLGAPGRRVCGWLKTHKMKPVNTPA